MAQHSDRAVLRLGAPCVHCADMGDSGEEAELEVL
jgi:hypothetical protein